MKDKLNHSYIAGIPLLAHGLKLAHARVGIVDEVVAAPVKVISSQARPTSANKGRVR